MSRDQSHFPNKVFWKLFFIILFHAAAAGLCWILSSVEMGMLTYIGALGFHILNWPGYILTQSLATTVYQLVFMYDPMAVTTLTPLLNLLNFSLTQLCLFYGSFIAYLLLQYHSYCSSKVKK